VELSDALISYPSYTGSWGDSRRNRTFTANAATNEMTLSDSGLISRSRRKAPSAGSDAAGSGSVFFNSASNPISTAGISSFILSDDVPGFSTPSVSGGTTRILAMSDFGFTVPAAATITGVKAYIERKQGSASTPLEDNSVLLYDGTSDSPTDKKATGVKYPQNVDSVAEYGGSSDLWGYGSLTPAQVNASAFALKYQAVNPTAGSSLLRIDLMEVEVFYDLARQPFATGDPVQVVSAGTLPGGLDPDGTYFVYMVDSTHFKLYDTAANAITGGATGLVDILDTGTGTHTLKKAGWRYSRHRWDSQF
jgi:hypothetical protein